MPPPRRDSYKEVLLRDTEKQTNKPTSVHVRRAWVQRGKRPSKSQWATRCYRCLATDHCVDACRDPVKCRACQ